jgi:hypothetical protein
MRCVYGKTSKQILAAVNAWVLDILAGDELERQCTIVKGWWTSLSEMWKNCDREEVEMRSREGMERLGNVVMGVLLVCDARRDGDYVARQVAEYWIDQTHGDLGAENWREQMVRDHDIVFGREPPEELKPRL